MDTGDPRSVRRTQQTFELPTSNRENEVDPCEHRFSSGEKSSRYLLKSYGGPVFDFVYSLPSHRRNIVAIFLEPHTKNKA